MAALLLLAGSARAQEAESRGNYGGGAASVSSPEQNFPEIRLSSILGMAVYGSDGQRIGRLDDIMLGPSGAPDGLLISIGGFLGVGRKLVSVPYRELQIKTDTVQLRNLTREEVRRREAFASSK